MQDVQPVLFDFGAGRIIGIRQVEEQVTFGGGLIVA